MVSKLSVINREENFMIYGYCRVSTKGQAKDGNSLEAQEKAVREAGASIIYQDAFTGTKSDRPQLNNLMENLKDGDKIIVTKLDRLARSARQGLDIVDSIISKGATIHILNMGLLDNSPTGKLIRTIFFAFAEFERDMIVERTQEGKAIAKHNAEIRGVKFAEGRPRKYDNMQIEVALELLETKSYTEVSKITGISKSTLIRAKQKK